MENVEKSVEGVCRSTISGKGALQFSPELHHHYPCLGNSLGRTGAISFCGYAALLARLVNRGPVIDVDFDLRRMDAAPIKVIDLS